MCLNYIIIDIPNMDGTFFGTPCTVYAIYLRNFKEYPILALFSSDRFCYLKIILLDIYFLDISYILLASLYSTISDLNQATLIIKL